MRFPAVVVAWVVAACGTSAPVERPAIPSDAPPGTRWITPLLPWHLADGAGGIIVTGNTALVAGVTRGEIEEIDLTTGARGRVHSLGKPMTVQSFVRISDGRYLVAGTLDEQVHAAFVDPVTFLPTWFPLDRLPPEKDAYASASALELADHGVLIAGTDLPLAIYDPTTLKRTRVLKEQATWTDVKVTRTAIYARRGAHETIRFDLATGTSTTAVTSIVDAAADLVVDRTYEKGNLKYRAIQTTTSGVQTRELPSTLGYFATIDSDGSRIASQRNGVVTVYSAAEGSVIGRFDLAPQNYFSGELVFAGQKLVIAYANTIRVADLATGSLTTVPEPYGPYQQLAVDDTGTITAIGAEVWRYQNARLASTASIGKQTALVQGSPLTRFATRTTRPFEPGMSRGKFPSVIVVKTLEGRTIREVSLPRETDAAWIGTEGKLIATYKWESDVPQELVRVQGSKVYDIVAFNVDASLDDVDVDGSTAAFSLDGTITLLDTKTGAKTREVYSPACAEFASAELERGGDRVLSTYEKDAILYDRTTGRTRGTARFPRDIYSTTFIPGATELLVRLSDRVLLWDPATNATRTLAYADTFDIAIAPDRRHAAMALRDGRLALIDFAAFRAAMKPGDTLPKVDVPTSCSKRDPFDLREAPEDTSEADDHPDSDNGIDDDDDEDTGD